MKFEVHINQCQNLAEIQMSQYFSVEMNKMRVDVSQLKAFVMSS